MKNFAYTIGHHYLFSDAKVRVCKDDSVRDCGGFYDFHHPYADKRDDHLIFSNDGIAYGCPLDEYPKIPHILLCIEDPTTWDWKLTSAESGGVFEAKITVGEHEYQIKRGLDDCYHLYKNHEYVSGKWSFPKSVVEELLLQLEDQAQTAALQAALDAKKAQLKADYDRLMAQATEIQQQIGEL